MVETKCIYGDCEYVEEQLNQYLNDGWNVLDMKTTLYDSTAGIRPYISLKQIRTSNLQNLHKKAGPPARLRSPRLF